MLFVIFRNIYDYLFLLFEGIQPRNPEFELLLDKKFDGLAGKINAFHNSVSINKKWNLPWKKAWYGAYADYEKISQAKAQGKTIVFLFFEGNRLAYQKQYLDYLKAGYPDAKFVFRFVNLIDKKDLQDFQFVCNNFDMLISMDAGDCRKYGMCYVPNTFWIEKSRIPVMPESDVIFLGNGKGRLAELIRVYQILDRDGMDCRFFVRMENNCRHPVLPEGIHPVQSMSYLQYLGYVQNSKCILEIVADGQKGSTLRAAESVFFEKRLITNNVYMKNESYYQEDAMQIYSQPEDLRGFSKLAGKPVDCWPKHTIGHEQLFFAVRNYFNKAKDYIRK